MRYLERMNFIFKLEILLRTRIWRDNIRPEDFLNQRNYRPMVINCGPWRNNWIADCKNTLSHRIQIFRKHEKTLYFCKWRNWIYLKRYTGWKGSKCLPLNSRRGRLKGPKNLYTIWGLNLIVFSEKGVSSSVLFTSYCLYR